MERLRASRSKREFDIYVTTAADRLYRTGYLMTGDAGETEDLLQETFVRVAQRWDRVRTMDHPLAYARRVLVNLVLDGTPARARRDQELLDPDGLMDVVDRGSLRLLGGIDEQAAFTWALAALPPRPRAVLILRYWDDLSEAEVAEVLGCPLGTVKSSASRGIAELRRILGRDGETMPARSSVEIEQERHLC
jgi:RNA polymerase sigma-70 factor (sigma-E family)